MDEQEAVEQVESTTEMESAPIEVNTEEPTEGSPADASIEPEEKNQGVPYDRFSEVNSRAKRAEQELSRLRQEMAQSQTEVPDLDPEAAQAVRKEIEAAQEQREYNKFQSKHGAEFRKDPLLESALNVEIKREIQEQQQSGYRTYIDREDMLERARNTINERFGQVKTEAKKEGLTQGQDIARTKQQLGAVGETGVQPKVDPESLSAADYAKHHNIPRSPY